MALAANLADVVLGASGYPAASASELGGKVFSSTELELLAQKAATDLATRELQADEPVILYISNKPEDLVGFLAIWLAGCVAVPIHVATPEPTVRALTTRVGARYAIRSLSIMLVGSAPPPPRPLLQGAALVVFTSGTTGEPKGVVLSHQGLSLKLQVLARLINLTSADVVVVPLQLTFIFGIWVSFLSMIAGARLVLAPKVSSDLLKSDGAAVSVLATVPTVLRSLFSNDQNFRPKLTKILTGGEPFGAELASRMTSIIPDAEFFDLFGLTETGSCDFCARTGPQSGAMGTIGYPTEGVEFQIEQRPDLELPLGVGELQIRSPSLMNGYLDDPDQTTATFIDGFFKTGDLVTLREDGSVQLVGRSKEIVSRGGNKIAPLEIENLFAQHEGVNKALAFGVPDERLGESLHLFVVPSDETLSEAQLRTWSEDRIERFKTPDKFHFVNTLPTGRTGKTDRAAARAVVSRSGS